MFQSIPQTTRSWSNSDKIILALVIIEVLLVTTAMIPPQIWSRLLPGTPTATQNGPFPAALAPVITTIIYLFPTFIGFLSRHWQRALLFATLPAWLGLGVFLIAASTQMGAFYAVSSERVAANVAILELFAALGGIGWLIRHLVKNKIQ